MWLKLLLLTLYLIFLFILSRILEAASWYQDTETFLTSFVALDPIKLSVKKLKHILDNRGISYSGVVEKQELVELVESSGEPTGQEVVEDASPSKVRSPNVKVTCGSHFYEEVEDTKDSAWLVQVLLDDEDKPILSQNVWDQVVSKVSEFGIRTGQFKCSLDRRLCQRKGWTSARLILALPQGNRAKEDVVMYDYLQSSTSIPVLRWVRNHLSSRVKTISSLEELKKWTEYSDGGPRTAIRIIFFSVLQSCPMFLSSLAIKFNGRVDFGIVDTSKNNVNYKKIINSIQSPTYLVVTPEKSFTYGSKKGESFNFKSMEIFLKTFVPEMNDILCWSLIMINALAAFELFIVYLQIWKHVVLYLLCMIKYNAVLMILWMLISTLYSFPFMTTVTNVLIKCVRIVSGSYVGTVIRNDFKMFYSYPFVLASFIMFAAVAGYIVKKYRFVNFMHDVEFLTQNWWIQPRERYIPSYFFRHLPNRTRSDVPQDLDLEVGMELLIERLAVPNLWLQPFISMDYLKELPIWKYQGWCKGDDPASVSDTSDDESANISSVKPIVNNIVPKPETLVDNLYVNDNSISVSTNSSPEKSKSPSEAVNNVALNPNSIVSSIDLCSSKINGNKSAEILDSDRAPRGMIEFRDCSICLEKYRYEEPLCGLPCGHNFHLNCIMTWLTRDNHCCPICRWPSYKAKIFVQHPHSL